MKTFLKIVAGLLVIIIIIVVTFVYTFDANNYKQDLAEVAEAITARPVNITGDIELSIYPWIGLKVNNVTIENPPGFSKKTFATIGQFDVRIKLMPLLQKRLDIEKLVLHRLLVDFEKNTAGENNWSNFADSSEGDNVIAELGLTGLAIGGIELTNSNLTWLDVNTDKQFKILTMNLGTEAVIKGQPLSLTLNAYVESNQPEWQASVTVKTKLEFNDDSFMFKANDLKLVVKALFPGAMVDKVSFAMIADSEINPQTQIAKLTNARLSVLGMIMTGTFDVENIFSVPVIQGTLKVRDFEARKVAKHFKVDIPLMANTESLKNISLTALFKTDFDSVYLDDISANVDESRVNGFVHISGIRQPIIRYGLKVDQIKLHDYRQISDESSEDQIPLPLDLIRSTDLEGVLDIETVVVDDIELTKFHITSQIKNSIVKAAPITMLVGESDVKATMKLDARVTPIGVFAVKVNNVDAKASINPLLKTIIGDGALTLEGIVNADVSLRTNGNSITAMKTAAQGTIKINMGKTIVQGIDLDHVTRSVTADYANKNNFRTSQSFVTEYNPDRKTEFKSLRATFKVSRGKLVNSDLLLVSDQANITGSGSIDFINGKLDYRPVVDMKVSNTIDIRDKLRDHPMEYHAHGAFENLMVEFNIKKYELLVGRLLVQEGKARRIKQKKNKSKNSWGNVLSK
jgi:AsmA protein